MLQVVKRFVRALRLTPVGKSVEALRHFFEKKFRGGQKEKHIFLIEIKLRASKLRRTELEKSKGAG